MPLELRSKVGNWVFGCDVCQEVCPWNLHFTPVTGDPAFAPRPGIARPNLSNDLKLTSPEFNRKFKASPILRARRRGYLRNVCVALGNQADPSSVPALDEALTSEPEPLVRSHAAWALGRIHTAHARFSLEKGLKAETQSGVQREIQQALAG